MIGLSNCCKAQVKIDEKYQCPCCGGNNTSKPVLELTVACKDCKEVVTVWSIEESPKKEYERLKQLDENVKLEIAKLENLDCELSALESSSSPRRAEVAFKIYKLKSLYK